MKRFLMLAFVLLCASLSTVAQAPAGGPVEQAVLKLEQQWVDALVKADAGALESLYHEELVYTHSSGSVDTKASYIESIRSGKSKYESIERDDIRVRLYGDTAIVTCHSVIKVNKNTINARYIHVYVKQKGPKGGWRMVAHQTTRLPQ
ncbi:MAG: nuclear transport factor 2 family protein [Blastocatellia bacterium]